MIQKTKKGYVVKSKDGKKTLSKEYETEGQALERLQQIEYFKNKDKKKKG